MSGDGMTRVIDLLLGQSRLNKRFLALAADSSLCVLTAWFAFYLRLGEWIMLSRTQWIAVGISLIIAIPVFVISGLYREIFRHSGLPAMLGTIRACLIYAVMYAVVCMVVTIPDVPRTIGIIQPMLLLLAISTFRAFAWYWLGNAYQSRIRRAAADRVIIYGAGSAGRQLSAAMSSSPDVRIVAYVDENVALQGRRLNSVPVFGTRELDALVRRLSVKVVVLAIPSATQARRNEIIHSLRPLGVRIRTLPGLVDLVKGHVQTSDLRELEIEDLLGRESVEPREDLLLKNISGKVVVVTGGGGSIGSELCRQILKLQPAKLLLIESSEFALYAIHRELLVKAEALGLSSDLVVPLLACVRDAARMKAIFAAWQPNTVYHAAAYKHVPLVEHNPVEGVRNNVIGTLVAATVSRDHGVEHFVLISTDKAVRPTSIMGASKRLAELVLQSLNDCRDGPGTCFAMVRFGNVLNSSGSVVPLFREQIRAGGPITITHPEITRYFMTIPEAAQLVIQASAMATGGEVFVLDMGQPVRIVDLAHAMIELSGTTVKNEANPDGAIAIRFTGLRPGEKLYEELLIGDNPEPTSHPKIMRANEKFPSWSELEFTLSELQLAVAKNDVPGLIRIISRQVPEYQHASRIVDFVSIARTSERPPAALARVS